MQATQLEARPGSYLLLLVAGRASRARIGRAGVIDVRRGAYLYAGSAMGPGGVRARVAHHSRPANRPHWHLDYLRSHARVARAWTRYGENLECAWAEALQLAGAGIPFAGFGSSDCGCPAHLFRAGTVADAVRLVRALGFLPQRLKGAAPGR